MTFTYSICKTCGTGVVMDEETGAEAHLDITYRDCGVEGELMPLVEHIEGTRTFKATPRLRVIK